MLHKNHTNTEKHCATSCRSQESTKQLQPKWLWCFQQSTNFFLEQLWELLKPLSETQTRKHKQTRKKALLAHMWHRRPNSVHLQQCALHKTPAPPTTTALSRHLWITCGYGQEADKGSAEGEGHQSSPQGDVIWKRFLDLHPLAAGHNGWGHRWQKYDAHVLDLAHCKGEGREDAEDSLMDSRAQEDQLQKSPQVRRKEWMLQPKDHFKKATLGISRRIRT